MTYRYQYYPYTENSFYISILNTKVYKNSSLRTYVCFDSKFLYSGKKCVIYDSINTIQDLINIGFCLNFNLSGIELKECKKSRNYIIELYNEYESL